MSDLFKVSSSSPPSATNSKTLPDPYPSPECIAATLLMGQLDNELCDQFAARGIDLNDEDQISDKEYTALMAPLERQSGLDKFDGAEQLAAMLWLLDHPDSESA